MKYRFWEKNWILNILILSLVISAVFLFFKAISVDLDDVFSYVASYALGEDENKSNKLMEGAKLELSLPSAVVVIYDEDKIQGVKYNYENKLKTFNSFSNLLTEAVGTASNMNLVNEYQYQGKILDGGLYLEFPNALPMEAYANMLGTKADTFSEDMKFKDFFISLEEEKCRLYFKEQISKEFYYCETEIDSSSLLSRIAEFQGDNVYFNFQNPDENEALSDYFIFTDEVLAVNYQNISSITLKDEERNALLSTFGINPNGSYGYTELDGSANYVDGNKSLRIKTDGEVTYSLINSESGGQNSDLGLENNEIISVAENILESTALKTAGNGTMNLVDGSFGESLSVLKFNYFVEGLELSLNEGEYGGEFQFVDGKLVRAELKFLSFEAEKNLCYPLPEKQMVALIEGDECNPRLYYVESKGELAAYFKK